MSVHPSCPTCGDNAEVQHYTHLSQRVWLCGSCWTVFRGDQDEWERNRSARELRKNHHKQIEAPL